MPPLQVGSNNDVLMLTNRSHQGPIQIKSETHPNHPRNRRSQNPILRKRDSDNDVILDQRRSHQGQINLTSSTDPRFKKENR